MYILFEHQSTPDYWMAFRLLCYMTNLWREYLDQNPKAGQLPIILPAVLYHGKKPWSAPVAFDEMLSDDEELARYIPRFSYDLYNLGDYPDETLLLGDYMALGVVLYLMKHIFDGDFGDRFVKAAEYLGTIDDQKVQLEFLEWMLRYTYHAREDDREYIDRGVDALNNESARRLAMTIAERIKQEGRLESRMELIQKILNKRFGNISPILEKRLKGSGLDDLYEFEENILDFNNLKDAEKWWDAHEN